MVEDIECVERAEGEGDVISRRETLIGLGLASSGLGVLSMKPKQSAKQLSSLNALIPDRVGAWATGSFAVNPVPQLTTYERSIYEQVVVRHYFKHGLPPMTALIAYNRAQNFTSELHRPEVCYPASGFKIVSQEASNLSLPMGQIPANYLRATRGKREDGVFYFTRVGDNFPTTLLEQRLVIAASVFSRRDQDGIIFRLSTPASRDQKRLAELKDFASAFYLALPRKGQQIIAGAHLSEKDE